MKENELDVGYRLLDDDILDSEGRRCGKVDDIEIEGKPGEPAHLSAIVVGPGAWQNRLPRSLRGFASKLFQRDVVLVPWSAVDDITAVVELNRPAKELRLGSGDDRARPLLDWLPGS
jgi:sporulation protein YlmC with PRC-barrel domain